MVGTGTEQKVPVGGTILYTEGTIQDTVGTVPRTLFHVKKAAGADTSLQNVYAKLSQLIYYTQQQFSQFR